MVVIGNRSRRDVAEGTSYGFFCGDPNVIGLGTPVDGIIWEEVDVVVRQFETGKVQCGDLAFSDFDLFESISRVRTSCPVKVIDFLGFGSCRCKYF